MGTNLLGIADIAPYFNNQIQSLILFPTEQCNFRCYYCYENYQNGRMSPDTINAIKKLLDAKSRYLKQLTISWFGGEPLIASDIVIDISNHAMELSKKFDFTFDSNITTNGYNLTSDMFFKLCKLGVTTFQISLDGPKNIHDKTRMLSDGSGTFDIIWNNIKSIRDSQESVLVILRVHIDEEKLIHIEELVDKIKMEFGGDSRFKVFFKPIARWGGKNDNHLRVLSKEKFDNILEQINSMLDKENIYSPNIICCYASQPNSLSIRSNGEVNKCTIALSYPPNNIGMINPNGTFTLDNAKLQRWVSGLLDRDTAIALCPYTYLNSME